VVHTLPLMLISCLSVTEHLFVVDVIEVKIERCHHIGVVLWRYC